MDAKNETRDATPAHNAPPPELMEARGSWGEMNEEIRRIERCLIEKAAKQAVQHDQANAEDNAWRKSAPLRAMAANLSHIDDSIRPWGTLKEFFSTMQTLVFFRCSGHLQRWQQALQAIQQDGDQRASRGGDVTRPSGKNELDIASIILFTRHPLANFLLRLGFPFSEIRSHLEGDTKSLAAAFLSGVPGPGAGCLGNEGSSDAALWTHYEASMKRLDVCRESLVVMAKRLNLDMERRQIMFVMLGLLYKSNQQLLLWLETTSREALSGYDDELAVPSAANQAHALRSGVCVSMASSPESWLRVTTHHS